MAKKSFSKLALVTGGSSGIGKAIAQKLSSQGVKVVVADILADKLGEEDEDIVIRKCDVTKREEIDALFEWVTLNLGHPDILILNAGRGIREKLSEGDPEKWLEVIQTNLMGPLRCSRAFTPAMITRGKGNVIFISSVSACKPHPYGGIYGGTKAALEVIAETLRLETLPAIDVSVISPGVVDTPFFDNEISGSTNVQELGMGKISPMEIAEDVWYILNKRAGTSINKIITRPSLQSF